MAYTMPRKGHLYFLKRRSRKQLKDGTTIAARPKCPRKLKSFHSRYYSQMLSRMGRWAFAGLFLVSGMLHFARPGPFVRIIPPLFPRPKDLVLMSGAAEILGGIGLLVPRTRRPAAYGLALLLIAVFPANIYMAVAHVPFPGLLGNRWLQWFRLPLQLPLIWLALYYAKQPLAAAAQLSDPP